MTKKGQTTTEAIILLPLVLFIIFGLIQACQIGVGLVMVNYAAGSIARKMVRMTGGVQTYKTTLNGLLIAGMTNGTLASCEDSETAGVTSNVIVAAQANITAYPFIGPFLDKAAPGFKSQNWSLNSGACQGKDYPAVGFTGPPKYQFIVRGLALARRNYTQ